MKTLSAACFLVLAAGCGAPNPPWDEARATQHLSVALVSLRPEASADTNRAHILDAIERVTSAHPEVRLIAFGELSLGWYWKGFDADYQRSVAEPLDGPTVTEVRALAQRHHVFIALGFAESADGSIFNSAVVIDDGGALVAHKRKSNFVPMDEAGGFTKGERVVPTFFIDGVKSALLICNDFNDATLRDAITGDPDIGLVVLPQASAGLKPETVERSPYPFGGAWMLAPQRLGWEGLDRYYGGWVVDPNGAVPARATEELLISELRFVPSAS
jgi:predicted amidohydrolase